MPAATVVTFGEPLLRLTSPDREGLLQSPRFDACFGGAELNVAVALAHLGTASRFVSVFPDSPLGDAALGEVRRHGVDTSNIVKASGRLGLYFLSTGAGPRASQVTYDRAGSAFASMASEAIDWQSALDGATWLHLSGVTLAVSEAAEAAARRAVDAAIMMGVQVSFDGNYRPQLWAARGGNAAEAINWFLDRADVAFADHRDLALICGAAAGDLEFATTADRFFARFQRLSHLAATRREVLSHDHHALTGMLATRNRGVQASRRWDLPSVVDRIGSGDAFAAGVLHGMIAGTQSDDTIAFATALAVLKHTLPGDFSTFKPDTVMFSLTDRHDVRR